MRKYILYITFTALISAVLSSCASDWTDRNPSTALPRELALGNRTEAFAALNGMMDAVQGTSAFNSWYGSRFIVHGDVRGDDMQATTDAARTAPSYMMQHTVHNAPTLWIQPYRAINRANSLIFALEDMDELPGADEAFVNDMIGQALTVRALAHFDLLRMNALPYTVGGPDALGVPLIITPQDPRYPPARNTVGEVYAQILIDLQDAIGMMFTRAQRTDNNIIPNSPYRSGTISGWFDVHSAMALLARVHLYMGNFPEAYRVATQVIAQVNALPGRGLGELRLGADGFIADWQTQIASEILFEIVNWNQADWVDRESIGYIYNEAGYGDGIMTQAFINLMETYFADDLRWGVMLPSRRDPNATRAWNIIIPANADQGIAADTIWNRVFINKYPGRGHAGLNNVPILRLSEMYLIAAEAAYQNNNPTSAARYLNAIVLRGNPNATPVAPADANLDRILKERRVEFVGEGHRFFDLMRNDRPVVRFTNDGEDPELNDAGWHLALMPSARSFDVRYWRAISPIPVAEMNANPNMVQNPGYGQ